MQPESFGGCCTSQPARQAQGRDGDKDGRVADEWQPGLGAFTATEEEYSPTDPEARPRNDYALPFEHAAAFRALICSDVDALLQKHHDLLSHHMDGCMEQLAARMQVRRQRMSVLERPAGERVGVEPEKPLDDGQKQRLSDYSMASVEAPSGFASVDSAAMYHPERNTGMIVTVPEPTRLSRCSENSIGAAETVRMQSARSLSQKRRSQYNAEFAKAASERLNAIPLWRRKLQQVVFNTKFELCFAVIIITNSLYVGIQVEFGLPGQEPQLFMLISAFYTIIFAFELLLRLLADGIGPFFCSRINWTWNYLDVAIVLLSLLEPIVTILGTVLSSDIGGEGDAGMSNMTYVRIIRIMRMVRIVRIIRVVRFFRSLRILVHSIMCTLKSLVWAMTLLVMIMYVFGILFTQASHDFVSEKGKDTIGITTYFGSVPLSIYTLFRAVSSGLNWGEVMKPILSMGWSWTLLFLAFISFTYFAVLNVVTGVFCQSAIESAAHDTEMVTQAHLTLAAKYKETFSKIFRRMDYTDSGLVTLEDFEEHLEDDEMKAYFSALDIDASDAWTLFKLLDVDDSECVDLDEFVEGCLKLKGQAKSIDIAKMMYDHKWMVKRLSKFTTYMEHSFADWTHALEGAGFEMTAAAATNHTE